MQTFNIEIGPLDLNTGPSILKDSTLTIRPEKLLNF